MTTVRDNTLEAIGNTPLVRLRKIVPANGARLLLKLENHNPTGSMKDRMALAMIEAAEADGRLEPGGAVVEYTGGSTGVSLALVCAVKGYRLHIATSDAFSREKRDHMELLGAKLEVVASDEGRITKELIESMIATAKARVEKEGAFWTDQLNNVDQITGYHRMADELWEQTGGRIDGFVQSVGTAGSIRGVSRTLRGHDADVEIVAVEPDESPVLSGGETGAHRIEGIGAGFVVPHWREDAVDRIERVTTEDALEMSVRLAREEGLFGGTSTGSNVIAALRLAERLGPDATVVTLMVDTGMKYLSTDAVRASTSSAAARRVEATP